jgi:uncharacterized protein
MDDVSQVVIQIIGSIQEVDAQQWDTLVADMPLLKHAFLAALETSGSVGEGTGWTPCIIVMHEHNVLIGAIPLYIKSHSYGEYVFDWAWADAYAQNGLRYYPKLLAAIPFSPITSSRLLTNHPQAKQLLIEALETVMQQHQLSSAHVLFPNEVDASLLENAGWMKRIGVQFRWQNEGYQHFEDFLQNLSHNKRKRIHQERKKVAQAGVSCQLIKGTDTTEADWDFFYACYCITYQQHRSTPYLTRAFFDEISRNMPQSILLMIATVAGERVASTLNFYSNDTLYGRYWGATQFISGLHFELCYYQAQQFCIAENIQYFEGGAQGEHKLARGFKPRPTCSFHKIVHPEFEHAIKDFLDREASGVAAYTTELEARVPFKLD